MIRRLLLVLVGLAVAMPCSASVAGADGWHSEQPLTSGSDVPVALGVVYDIKFWAPNRGVLITADGLWAYDGTTWHQLSTVCGGTNGRIAWAGPLDFWTISDQPAGQSSVSERDRERRSLCHFVNGAVVASYAQPLGFVGSYEPMNAAVCLAADDCWFGGERLPGTVNTGAFHLHWDGQSLTAVPSLTMRDPTIADPDRAVADLAVNQGRIYESVRVDGNDVDGEDPDHPYLLHEIVPGSPPAFVSQFTTTPIDYAGQPSGALSGLLLSSDGSTLWAAAGRNDPNKPLKPMVMRLGPDGLMPLTLHDSSGVVTDPVTEISALAAEPGTDSAWLAYTPLGDLGQGGLPARLARVHADGTVDSATELPSDADRIARKSQAYRVACPAQGQCWMSTQTGWLFHLGGSLAPDTDPAMHRLITYRPPDASTVIQPPDTLPADDSGIAPPSYDTPLIPILSDPSTAVVKPKPKPRKLVTGLTRRLVKRTTLELRFTLTAKANVQVVAKRKKTIVARTKKAVLAKGKHILRLKLSTKHWPTALDFRVTAYKATKKR